jgi:hypothetical protein
MTANRVVQRMSVSTPVRIAAILLWINAVGFGLPCLLAIRSLSAGRGIATLMGYPPTVAGRWNGSVSTPTSHW